MTVAVYANCNLVVVKECFCTYLNISANINVLISMFTKNGMAMM